MLRMALSREKKAEYKVTIQTGNRAGASTINSTYIKLVGTDGESDRTWAEGPLSFFSGPESTVTVSCPKTIGKLVLIEIDKKGVQVFPDWFLAKVEVKSPEGDTYTFPIHHWITDTKVHRFAEGTACRIFEVDRMIQKELSQRMDDYRWKVYKDGMPHCIKADSPESLPPEVRFSFIKSAQFTMTAVTGQIDLKWKGLAGREEKWKDIEEIHQEFRKNETNPISDYVQEHWMEDAFFGYQYLNGVNPMMIKRCTALPSNFPVTYNKDFPWGGCTLKAEMKRGNIFLADYKLLDGVKTNTINGKKQYLMAPLVLLHKTVDDQLMPIAIQLKQTPADDNPIFFPTDSEYDWLMAKIFVRSADFNLHQLNVHLLRTHLLPEVFAVSLLRNVPMVHPLYKLLKPHTRYTLQINIMARQSLISEDGVFTQFAASGGKGMITILRRSLNKITYSSLCIPDDIAERGLEDVPNFYYRDDGLRLWDIIHRFVHQVLTHYYKNDADVEQDPELQEWIWDIIEHGFLSRSYTGIPQRFTSVTELVKFVTMVIFTCSAQHAAVSSGQYDYGGWMPNAPSSLQRPPPTKKGTTNKATMLETFPDVNTTANGMAAVLLLSKQSYDFVRLGDYPEERFTEEIPLKLIKEFQGELEGLSDAIKDRNRSLDVPYTYLNPTEVENSVSL